MEGGRCAVIPPIGGNCGLGLTAKAASERLLRFERRASSGLLDNALIVLR